MKPRLLACALMAATMATPSVGMAFTPCALNSGIPSYGELSVTQIEALLGTSMACYPQASPFENQEYHTGSTGSSTGNIIDYKKGPTDPIDPSETIGGYSISTTSGRGAHAIITYTYTGNPSSNFTYTVWGPEPSTTNLYDFCVGTTPLAGGPVRIIPQVGGTPVPC